MNPKELVNAAVSAMRNSYSPYSSFCVGAAILCSDGTVYTGCNVENASYGATVCAERTAAVSAVSDGKRAFSAIAVVGGKNGEIRDFCPPCGICRQFLSEFSHGNMPLYLYNGEQIKEYTLSQLLPDSFSLDGADNK